VLRSEVPHLNGAQIGRHSAYDEAGNVVARVYVLETGVVSRARYDAACENRPELPRYEPDPPATKRRRTPTIRVKNTDEQVHKRAARRVEDAAQQRSFVADKLAGAKEEARRWILGADASSPRTFGEMATEESLAFVDEMYQRGAAIVYVVELDSIDDADPSAGHLLVRLAPTSAKREAIFNFANEFIENRGFDAEVDDGHDYLYVYVG